MTHKKLIQVLTENDIPFVLIGGVALRLYNSPRVTHDIDVVIRTLDIDTIISIMYNRLFYLVIDVTDAEVTVTMTSTEAKRWVEETKSGSLSFIELKKAPGNSTVPMEQIDVTTQVDFLFETAIPIMKLRKNARRVQLDDLSFYVASIEDLITLKEKRSDKSPADEDDIRFLKSLLEKK